MTVPSSSTRKTAVASCAAKLRAKMRTRLRCCGRSSTGTEPSTPRSGMGEPVSATMSAMSVMPADRARLQRRALRLEFATIAWNLGEAVLTVGLGTDSVIEVFASLVVVWHVRPGHAVDHPARTSVALRLVAGAFALLAVVLATVAVRDLVPGRRAG